jgi:hypothetical protein
MKRRVEQNPHECRVCRSLSELSTAFARLFQLNAIVYTTTCPFIACISTEITLPILLPGQQTDGTRCSTGVLM